MEPNLPFDPAQRSAEAEKAVMKGRMRLYYKFRAAPYYGGIATADAVGCSFLCAYCWNYGRNENPSRFGRFHSPDEVAVTLLGIARKRSYNLFRITGSEPVLGEESFHHLLEVIKTIFREQPGSRFILETNGLMLGLKPELSEKLQFENLLVRIALKGTDPLSFEKIAGAKRDFFPYPLLALNNLQRFRVRTWPAIMEDFFTETEIENLKDRLRETGIRAELELESLEPYPVVLENMRRRGIFPRNLKQEIS
jgi:uncharacterized Fe-S cluster-containing radical SAM superfamily protein